MPVPFFLGELEWAPVVRLAFFTGMLTALMVADGGGFTTIFGVLGLVQTALYVALFYLAVSFAVKGIQRVGSPPMQVAAVGTVIFLLGVSSLLPLYETPLSSTRARSAIWHIFE